MNIIQYFSRLFPQLSRGVVFWYKYFSDKKARCFDQFRRVTRTINMPSTAARRLTKKNISYLEYLCTQPPPINTTAPELTALLIRL